MESSEKVLKSFKKFWKSFGKSSENFSKSFIIQNCLELATVCNFNYFCSTDDHGVKLVNLHQTCVCIKSASKLREIKNEIKSDIEIHLNEFIDSS